MTIALVIIAATIIGLLGGWIYAGFPLRRARVLPGHVRVVDPTSPSGGRWVEEYTT